MIHLVQDPGHVDDIRRIGDFGGARDISEYIELNEHKKKEVKGTNTVGRDKLTAYVKGEISRHPKKEALAAIYDELAVIAARFEPPPLKLSADPLQIYMAACMLVDEGVDWKVCQAEPG